MNRAVLTALVVASAGAGFDVLFLGLVRVQFPRADLTRLLRIVYVRSVILAFLCVVRSPALGTI